MASSSPTPDLRLQKMASDPDFLGLSPADKRDTLSKATGDPSFANLTDADTMDMVSKMRGPQLPSGATFPKIPPELQNTSTTQDAQESNARQMMVAGMTGIPTPNMNALDRTNFATGKAAGAATVPVAAGAAYGATVLPGLAVDAISNAARAALPHVQKLTQLIEENPKTAKAIWEVAKTTGLGAALIKGLKKSTDIATAK